MSDKQVSIYMRHIVLDVVVPKERLFSFMQAYGEAFRQEDTYSGTSSLKSVLKYYENPASYHVVVQVSEYDEGSFYDFVNEFCESSGLSFRDPDQEAPEGIIPFPEHSDIISLQSLMVSPSSDKQVYKEYVDEVSLLLTQSLYEKCSFENFKKFVEKAEIDCDDASSEYSAHFSRNDDVLMRHNKQMARLRIIVATLSTVALPELEAERENHGIRSSSIEAMAYVCAHLQAMNAFLP
jgi:hypothetical protein